MYTCLKLPVHGLQRLLPSKVETADTTCKDSWWSGFTSRSSLLLHWAKTRASHCLSCVPWCALRPCWRSKLLLYPVLPLLYGLVHTLWEGVSIAWAKETSFSLHIWITLSGPYRNPTFYFCFTNLCVCCISVGLKDKPEVISPWTFSHPGILLYPEYFTNERMKTKSFSLVKLRGLCELPSCTYLHRTELASFEYWLKRVQLLS